MCSVKSNLVQKYNDYNTSYDLPYLLFSSNSQILRASFRPTPLFLSDESNSNAVNITKSKHGLNIFVCCSLIEKKI